MLPKMNAILDKLAKKNIIHKNKASNLKSSLVKACRGPEITQNII